MEPVIDSLNNTGESWVSGSGRTVANPVTMKEVELYKENFALGSPLDDDELEIFKAQFSTLLAAPGSEERRLMLDRLEAYVVGLRAVKQALNGVKFVGLNPEDTELGFGHIRPVFTQVNGVVKTTWSQALTSAYADWFDDASSVGYVIGDSFGLCITHLKSLISPTPFMAEAQFTIGRTGVLVPVDVRNLRIADTVNQVAVVPLPTILLIPKASFYAQARSDVSGTEEAALGGLAFGLGRALKATTTYPST